MAANDSNLAARSGSLVEAHTTFQPRIFIFYFFIAGILLILAAGFAYQQLFKTGTYQEAERVQNRRRIIEPGPRGNIYDREGRLLVGNRSRFAVVVSLDELRAEFRREFIQIRKNYRATGDKDIPTAEQLAGIARVTVAQRYLDQVNVILGRDEKINASELKRHFNREMLLPYTLLDNLTPEEFARLVERLPVRSPLQVYAFNTRDYPYGSAAAHTLGYVRTNTDIDTEALSGEDLKTFKMKGTIGRDGLERQFDEKLQGKTGGKIYRVDPSGYRINPPLEIITPAQGERLVTSLDIDLQLAAEKCMTEEIQNPGAAVALDVNTGEVLVLASNPGYDLNKTSPHLSQETWDDIIARDALRNRAIGEARAPGSTFKLITSIAGFRSGVLTPQSTFTATGLYKVGNHIFHDARGDITGEIDYRTALEKSVNTYFINFGLLIGVDALAAEAHRFHLDERTGIELPGEQSALILIGTPQWKKKSVGDDWRPGDTANMAFGQGYVAVTPLQMACLVASLARGETYTKPLILHQENRPPQRTEPIGISVGDYQALIEGMQRVVISGTARSYGQVPGLTIAGKTGTAQVDVTRNGRKGKIELAWFVGFAPVERPEIAFAVLTEGDTPDESYGGAQYAAPVATAILKKWLEKKQRGPAGKASLFQFHR
jgi:penicillin-binding protein 2